jgi:hypothetical protein
MLHYSIHYVTFDLFENLFWISPLVGSTAIGVVGRMLLKHQPAFRIQLSKYSFVVGVLSIIVCLDCSMRFWPFSDLGFGHSDAPVWWIVLFWLQQYHVLLASGFFLAMKKQVY